MRKKSLDHHTLILVMGVAGSGKTTIARALLDRIWAVYLDNNFVADSFFPETRTAPEYLRVRPKLYQVLYEIAEENLQVGNSVVLGAPHIKEVQCTWWHQLLDGLLSRTGSARAIIRCFCTENTLRQRLQHRGAARDIWKLTHWEEFLLQEPPLIEIPFEHININTEEPIDGNVERALGYLAAVSGRDSGAS